MPLLPLAEGFEEEDGGGDGDVEGVEGTEHRDAYVGVGGLSPDVGQAGGLGAHHDGGRLLHVGVVVQGGVLKLRGEYLNMFVFEPGDGLLGGGDCHLSGKHGSYAGPDEVRVIEVGERVADDDGIGSGSIGTSEHGAKVAWLLNALKHYDERILAESQALQSPFSELNLSDDTLRAAPVGYLAVKFVRNLYDTYLWIQPFRFAKKVVQFLLCQQLSADEQSLRNESGVKTVAEFPAAFNNKQPFRPPKFRLLLKRQQLLDLLVLSRCDVLDSHNNLKK